MITYPYQGLMAETVTHRGHSGDLISAYFARPLGPGPYPNVIVIRHMPGRDDATKQVSPRKHC